MRRAAAYAVLLLFGLACNHPKTLDVRAPKLVYRVAPESVDQTVAVLRARLDRSKITSRVEREGADIVVRVEPESLADAQRMLAKPGKLEFDLIDDSAQANTAARALALPEGVTLEMSHWTDPNSGKEHENATFVAKTRKALEPLGALVRPSWRVGFQEQTSGSDSRWLGMLHRAKSGPIDNDLVQDAEVVFDSQLGRPEVNVTLTPEGAKRFEMLTEDNVGRKLAIFVDGEIQSAPIIMSKIGGGRVRITMGSFGDPMQLQQAAKDLAGVLRAGALPAPLELIRMENK